MGRFDRWDVPKALVIGGFATGLLTGDGGGPVAAVLLIAGVLGLAVDLGMRAVRTGRDQAPLGHIEPFTFTKQDGHIRPVYALDVVDARVSDSGAVLELWSLELRRRGNRCTAHVLAGDVDGLPGAGDGVVVIGPVEGPDVYELYDGERWLDPDREANAVLVRMAPDWPDPSSARWLARDD